MIDQLLTMFVALPLLGAGISAVLSRRPRATLTLLISVLVLNAVGGILLVSGTAGGEVYAPRVGDWPAGISIPFILDAFSALMIMVSGGLILIAVVFALLSGTGRHRLFPTLIFALTAGVNGALLTGDLFNLFIFIEVMLIPSYGLLVLARRDKGTSRSVTGSRIYVSFNLFASSLLLAGIGFVYGTAGSVHLGELAGAAQESPHVAAATALCLAALSMKAAVVPVHGWLSRSYPTTSPAMTALFSALHTKIAIYGIYRLYAVVYDGDTRHLWIGIVVFSATMLVGVLGAVGEDRMRSILAFHMVSQIGYILIGLALFTPLGLAAGIFYLIHNMIVKMSLFLSAGAIESRFGTDRLDDLRGRIGREPVLAVAFGVAAFSLAGLPPFSGFAAKLSLVWAAVDQAQWAVVAIALVTSLLTLMSMLKIFNAVFAPTFTGADPQEPLGDGGAAVRVYRPTSLGLAAPAVVLAAATLVLGLGAQALLGLAEVAADGLVDTTRYVEALMR
ncbi:monovalent cation/H+ antiporter subunit D family protein [Flaviflexus salsibiostraticola]|uniref:Monovalent cation/H+ antiporter subunit D family protein n=1 Tax=Flaviflexus salsibiostraticola TaxID=1282737 RepID=A0A3S8ZB54_9ACTO|nr:monovalent cation/H+ antiporter subunit D family protein [Flaviflexus salsibiostraticola]AZN30692.1 monovalent cation/H+ antiporter subunit D family protein [Flaviflexus salsibiostraticola]